MELGDIHNIQHNHVYVNKNQTLFIDSLKSTPYRTLANNPENMRVMVIEVSIKK